jgi:hypothetical protein
MKTLVISLLLLTAYNVIAQERAIFDWFLVLHVYVQGEQNPRLMWSEESSTQKMVCEQQKLNPELPKLINDYKRLNGVQDVQVYCVGVPHEDE